MATIQFKPALIKTKNVRNLEVMMDGLAVLDGDGCMAAVCSDPGKGKTYSCMAWAAQHNAVYMRSQYIWRGSELEFIQGLSRAIGIANPYGTRGKCYLDVVDRLNGSNRAIFIDEMQRLPRGFLNIVLDLADITGCPVVLIGEMELKSMMQENKRIWSRTFRFLEYEPINPVDIMLYATETTGIRLNNTIASILHRASEGDFRLVKRAMIALVQFVNAKGPGEDGVPAISEEMARIAADEGLKGRR